MSVSLAGRLIQKRKYLLGVTPKAVVWYGRGFKALETASESKETVNQPIAELQERGVEPITISSYPRTVNVRVRQRYPHLLFHVNLYQFLKLFVRFTILLFTGLHCYQTDSRLYTPDWLTFDIGRKVFGI